MTFRLAAPLALFASCSACSSAVEVEPDVRAAAEQWVRKDQLPASVTPVAVWHANANPAALICGEIEGADPTNRKRVLRYVYDATGRRPSGQVEMHESWLPIGATSEAVLEQNRATFDGLWQEHCAPFAPTSRRLAAATGIDFAASRPAPRERSADEIRQEIKDRNAQVDQIERELRDAR